VENDHRKFPKTDDLTVQDLVRLTISTGGQGYVSREGSSRQANMGLNCPLRSPLFSTLGGALRPERRSLRRSVPNDADALYLSSISGILPRRFGLNFRR
jgi:hypothetical protein